MIELATKFIYLCWFYLYCNIYSQNEKNYFFHFNEYNKERFKEKSGLSILFVLFFDIFKEVINVFSLNLKMSRFICNKASFSFLMFGSVCNSSLMNAQNCLKWFCYSREASSGTVSDFLTTISVGMHHFVSSIFSQKHFWFSYTSVDYSFACSHIPIPLSLHFCWICSSVSSRFCFPLTFLLVLALWLFSCYNTEIIVSCVLNEKSFIKLSSFETACVTFICLFHYNRCEKRANDFIIKHREESKKSSFHSSLLYSNFTIISSRSAILHSFIGLLCIFHVNRCLLFISWWCERENIPLLRSLTLSKGSSLNAMQSLPVGTSHSWQLDARHFLYPQQTVIVTKQLEISHHTAKEQDCALWSVQVLHLYLHWWDWYWDDDTVVYYGNHPVLQETHALHGKDCAKVFRFENSGINRLCLMFLWENWRYGGIIITQSWENCVFTMDVS